MSLLWAWICGSLGTCPVCHRRFDRRRPGGKVVLESWGQSGIMMGSAISAGTCRRCPGTYWDLEYVHHANGGEAQVNSKPNECIYALPHPPEMR